ncbi:MAG: DUF4397 domain-containing protein [Burkholderiales bacterium]
MKDSRRSAWLVAALAAVVLQACGGGGSDSTGSADLRVINATQSHTSIDLLAGSTTIIAATPLDTASAVVAQTAGSITFQANDAGDGTALVTATSAIGKDLHYSLLAYEASGAVKLAVIGEDSPTPTTGTAQLRVFDAASSAGTLDVYVTAPGTNLAGVAAPTFTISAPNYAQPSALASFAPGTYRVRVTAADNKTDLRLDIPAITLADQAIATVVLTPSAGANLVNGGLLLQQGSFTPYRNTNARVRLAAAVSGGATVAASAGSTAIETALVAPSVGAYTLVPTTTDAALAVTINGNPLTLPTLAPAAGSDATLLVHGSPGAATASLITDDNLLPSAATKLKMRLVNGVTGAATALTLNADFSVIASNVQPGQASAAALVTGNSAMRLEVTSPLTQQSLYLQSDLSIPGAGVYTLFMLGDSAAPVGLLRRDR